MNKFRNVYIGLVHYPVLDKNGNTVATTITNYDLHDISRTAATYNISRYFLINPIRLQAELSERIRRHWVSGYGSHYNPTRKDALAFSQVVETIEDSLGIITEQNKDKKIHIVTTSARNSPRRADFEKIRGLVKDTEIVYILFGTGWGLAESVYEMADHHLEPIYGVNGYNHLSVRSAAAIILDRLLYPLYRKD